MGLYMSDERSSEKNAATDGTDQHRVLRRVRLVRKAETAHTGTELTLEAQKTKEKNVSEPWYFTHI